MLTSPINVEDLRVEMGAAAGVELTALTNTRAKFKPVNLGTQEPFYGVVTDAMRKAVNYGHRYMQHNCGNWAVNDFANAPIPNGFMGYTMPAVRRLLDYDGYSHQQQHWWTCSANRTSIQKSSAQPVLWSLDWESFFETFGGINWGTSPQFTLNFGFFMTQQALATATNVYWYQVTKVGVGANTLPDIVGNFDGKIPMYVGSIPEGTWHVIPAWYAGNDFALSSMTQLSPDDDSFDDWSLYPFCNTTDLTVTSDPTPGSIDNIMVEFPTLTVTTLDYLVYRITALTLKFTNESTSSAIPVIFSVAIEGDVMSGANVGNGTVTVPLNSSTTSAVISGSNYHDFALGTVEARLCVTIWLASDPTNVRKFYTELPI